ncbi:MAG: viroplasmin family protein [Lachnospiraceae bacterium]|nr:viroplasmin family protein [Lachnospiraceae bacterium]
MGSQKYYAVRVGKRPGIYYSWDECKEQVEGVKGASYKSFLTIEEAGLFLAGQEKRTESPDEEEIISADTCNSILEEKIKSLKEDEVIAFVDGSYDVKNECSGYGAIIIYSDGERKELCRHFDKDQSEDFIALRNVAAELEGVKAAIDMALADKKKKITIVYDYSGIENWANDSWRANKDITRNYKTFIRESEKKISLEFFKVTSHTGIIMNDEADVLAKRAANPATEDID